MLIYYIAIFITLIFGYAYGFRSSDGRRINGSFLIIAYIVPFVFIFGLRYEVGVDWDNYIRVYERLVNSGLKFDTLELGYKIINLFGEYTGLGLSFVIFSCTLLFVTLTLFGIRKLGLNPFYFFALVAPYHFVMSGMNLTRQSVSMSFLIFSMYYLLNNKRIGYIICILLGISFHTSLLPFIALAFINLRKRYLSIFSLIAVPAIIVSLFGVARYQHYFSGEMDSAGLYLRAIYLLVPAILLFTFKKRLVISNITESRLVILVYMSFPLMILVSQLSSTIADRFSYYFILLTTVVWLHLNRRRSNPLLPRYYSNLFLFFTSFIAFFMWTFFSSYIRYYEFQHMLFM
jgi:hypothetical protein